MQDLLKQLERVRNASASKQSNQYSLVTEEDKFFQQNSLERPLYYAYVRRGNFLSQMHPITSIAITQVIQQNNIKIFLYTLSLLKIWAYCDVFPLGKLENQLFVELEVVDEHNGSQKYEIKQIQLQMTQHSSIPPPAQQLASFAEFLGLSQYAAKIRQKCQFTTDIILKRTTPFQLSPHIINLDEREYSQYGFDFLKQYNAIYYCSGQVLNDDQLLKFFYNYATVDRKCFFAILSRFLLRHKSVKYIQYVPDYVDQYIVYQQHLKFPDYFLELLNLQYDQESLLKEVRALLGVFPEQIECYNLITENLQLQHILKNSTTLPIFIKQRFVQIYMLNPNILDKEIYLTEDVIKKIVYTKLDELKHVQEVTWV